MKIPKGQSETVYRRRTDNAMAKRKGTKGQEEFEDTKGVLGNRISKKNRQHNGQKKKKQKNKQRSTKHTHKTKDRVTRTPHNL